MSNKNEYKPLTAKKLRKAFGQLIDYHMNELRDVIADDSIREDSDVREYVLSQIVTDDVLNYINSHMEIQPTIGFSAMRDRDMIDEDGDIEYDKAAEIVRTIVNRELRPVCYDEPSDSYEWNRKYFNPEGYGKKLFKHPVFCASRRKIKKYRYEYSYYLSDAHDEYFCTMYACVFLTAKGKWKFVKCNDIECYTDCHSHEDLDKFVPDYNLEHYIRVDEPGLFRIDFLRDYIPVEYRDILFT